MKEKVSILIPTRFDSRLHLDLCLRSIRKHTAAPYRLLVGDGGVDEETRAFLAAQPDVTVVPCPQPLRAKDTLARAAETEFFLFQHDDTVVLRDGWLERRMELMERDPALAVVGVKSPCFVEGLRSWIELSPLDRRFLPLCMLVRRAAQEELDLLWGIYPPFDTGALAYLQIRKQRKWKFRQVKFNREVKHWGRMAWIMKKTELEKRPDAAALLAEREAKLAEIRRLLDSGEY